MAGWWAGRQAVTRTNACMRACMGQVLDLKKDEIGDAGVIVVGGATLFHQDFNLSRSNQHISYHNNCTVFCGTAHQDFILSRSKQYLVIDDN